MKRMAITLILLCCAFITNASPLFAVENPSQVTNNKYGIHIHDENDLNDATNLLNSSGGDWGYVTLVIRDDQRKPEQWNETFNKLRKMHLIPIVRIASKTAPQYWEKADSDQIDDWVNFLNALTWVTKNRYVIPGNEPNHAKEWGGSANPEEYSDYLLNMALALKKASPDFYVLPAGLDASAPTDNEHMDEAQYLERMVKKNPTLFNYIDGWNSHSYPNPGFSGSPTDTGRGSIRTYEWELELLKKLGVSKPLPVFITETGWIHPLEETIRPKQIEKLSSNYKEAFETVWNDPRVVAVTPFILNYQGGPFDTFSWKKKDGTFFDFYTTVKELPKVKGEPIIINSGEIDTVLLPEVITIKEVVYGLAYVKNTGQKIWHAGVTQTVDVEKGKIEITPTNPLSDIEPGKMGTVLYRDVTPKTTQTMQFNPYFDTIGLASRNFISWN